MGWHDDGVKIRVYVSESGDFVSLGTRVEYPFEPGGTYGQPLGWGPNTVDVSRVNWTTSNGVFSASNKKGTPGGNSVHGITKQVPVKAGTIVIADVECRTMENKTATNRQILISLIGSGWTNGLNRTSQADWETITSVNDPGNVTDGTLYIQLGVTDSVDINWGVQFRNVAITTVDKTYAEPVWYEVTCDIKNMSARYGRERISSRYEVASMSLSITNNDGEWTYQPHHPKGLRPGRFIKVECELPGEQFPFPMFYGLIDGMQDGYALDGQVMTVLNAVDVSSLLSNTNVPTVTDPATTMKSGNRVNSLLRAVGWHPGKVNLANGVFYQQAILNNGRSVLDELGLSADSEGSHLFADRLGNIVYRGRDWNWPTNTMVTAELLAQTQETDLPVVDDIPNVSADIPIICLRDLSTSWSRDRVINEISLANQGGSAVKSVSADSQKKYGPRTYQRMDLLNDNGHPEYLTTRIDDLMAGYTEAVLRLDRVTFRPDEDSWKWAMNIWLYDLVRVRYEHPELHWGFSVVAHVQGIEHSADSHNWMTSIALDDYENFTYFVFVDVESGWDTGLWDDDIWDGAGSPDTAAHWNAKYLWSNDASKWG